MQNEIKIYLKNTTRIIVTQTQIIVTQKEIKKI